MTHLDQLPVDTHDPLDPEKQILETLFPSPIHKPSASPPSTHHPFLKTMEELLTIILLFLVFNLPVVDQTIERFGIHNHLVVYLIKIFLIIIFFGILKRCLEVNG